MKPNKTQETGLQKFTDSEIGAYRKVARWVLSPVPRELAINPREAHCENPLTEDEKRLAYQIIVGEPINDLNDVNGEDLALFISMLSKGLARFQGYDLDALKTNTWAVIANDTRVDVKARSFQNIVWAIDKLTKETGRFPSRVEIAKETGLSRPTVNRYLEQYAESEMFKQREEEFVMMREKVLAKTYRLAVEGDMRAARLFLDATSGISAASVNIKNQQNNLNITGLNLQLSEADIQALPPDVLQHLQGLMKKVTQGTGK
jgi:hypothetical protein